MFIPLHDHNPLVHVRRQYVTWGIIALNVAVFLLVEGGGLSSALLATSALSYGLVPAVFFDLRELTPELAVIPESLSIVSYAFLHGSWLHLGGNMIFLWVFGDNVEDAMGHGRFAVFYLLCAAASGFVQAAIDPGSTVPIVGASGAVAGIIGAYLVLHPRVRVWVLALGRIPLRVPASWALVAWFGFQVAKALGDVGGGVAWWAHIGGFLAGALLIVPMRRRGVPLFDRGL
ncbi:rhomboid family intramembrane serine protease [Stappia sp. F7233]|uniref:Rhomboid family intramembrane serine protease n=1 Tax=Stappia albiluteola TaxID=2758565 RepID=A0A839AGX9_9HYPH|nr:rhomboid family intramembrane serine protease [Stappia albiluteola]MBA5778941.1 rhomboid family intramembrane serine protease [Stappia albiluteola]